MPAAGMSVKRPPWAATGERRAWEGGCVWLSHTGTMPAARGTRQDAGPVYKGAGIAEQCANVGQGWPKWTTQPGGAGTGEERRGTLGVGRWGKPLCGHD
jgi:hypothetical protein